MSEDICGSPLSYSSREWGGVRSIDSKSASLTFGFVNARNVLTVAKIGN